MLVHRALIEGCQLGDEQQITKIEMIYQKSALTLVKQQALARAKDAQLIG